MSTIEETQKEIEKVKGRSRERLKQIKELEEENKELRIQNKFLVDRLEVWAERNFEQRQKWMNMTVDEVIAINKNKPDYAKEKELAKAWDEQSERVSKMKVANG
jgi:type I site-specific restriction endonuclease